MTIPTLLRNIQDKQFKVAYKKDVALISEAMKLLYANEDISLKTDFGSRPQYVCSLRKYMKVKDLVFDCTRIENYTDDPNDLFDNWIVKNNEVMWHQNGEWFTKNKMSMTTVSTYQYSTVHFNNGAMIFFPCLNLLYIDVNGYNKPNVIGRDIFALPVEDNSYMVTTKIKTNFKPQSC